MCIKHLNVWFLLLVAPACSLLSGQDLESDSLLGVYHSENTTDIEKVRAIIALGGSSFRRHNPDSLLAIQIANQSLVDRLGSASDRITMANHQGLALYYLDDYWKSLEVLGNGERLAREVKDTTKLIKILNAKANCYLELSNFSASIDELADGLLLAEASNNEAFITTLNSNLGLNYLHFKKYEKARGYFEDDFTYSIENQNYTNMIYSLTNIGITYFEQENYIQALSHHSQAYDLVVDHAMWEVGGTVLLNIGECFFKLGNTTKAKAYNLKAIAVAEQQQEQPAVVRGNIHLAHIYRSEKLVDSAFYFANIALPLAKNLENKVILQHAADILYQLFEDQKDFQKALEMFKFRQSVIDSIASLANRQVLLAKEVEQKYQEEKLADKISFEQAIAEQRLKSQARFYLFLMAILVIAGTIVIIEKNRINKRRQKRDQLLKQVEVLRERVVTRSLYSNEPENKFQLDKEAIERYLGTTIGVSSWKILSAIYEDPTIKNSEIAEQIHLSLEGVSSSLRRMYKKFDLKSKDTRNLKISLVAKAVKISLGEEV